MFLKLLQTSALVCVVILLPAPSTASDVFTSLEHMKGLARLENFLQELLDKYIKRIPVIPRVLRDFHKSVKEQTRAKFSQGVERFVAHPTNAFLLMRRFLKHWTELANYLDKGPKNDLRKILNDNRPAFPSPEDFHGCASAILRIQDVYNLTSRQIADGQVSMETKGLPLGADECYELGYVNHDWKFFEQSRDWMRETLRRMGSGFGYKGLLTRPGVLEYLAWAEYQVGELENAIKHTKEIIKEDPKNVKAKKTLVSIEQQLNYKKKYSSMPAKENIQNRQKNKEDFIFAYEQLCRGETTDQLDDENLRCFYKTSHPLLRLKPAKIEIVSHEPEVQILHGAITDSEIKFIKEKATPRLKRAHVTNTTNGKQEFSDYRISKSAWIDDDEGAPVVTLTNRLAAMTGLSLSQTHSEPLQVVNYGVGGHYEPHYDYLGVGDNPSLDEGSGDRIATVLLYMSNLGAGGATVFLEPEAIIHPQKGDAVFWFNLLKSGDPDARTQHGACPVIMGSKWVANKWILQKGQEFLHRCGLTSEE